MLNCVPQEVVVTTKFLMDLAVVPERLQDFFDEYPCIYIHFPTLLKSIGECSITKRMYIRILLEMWEADRLRAIPDGDVMDELPSIVSMNARFPDNIKVFCFSVEEYIKLRKNFGKEDIGGPVVDAY